jgi:lysophospholipase L1-like esterase
MHLSLIRARCLLLVALLALPCFAQAAKPKPAPDHWVGTWATANVAAATANPNPAPGAFIPGAADSTLRQIVHTSLGGKLVRVEFSNALGTDPLTLGPIHIALADPKSGTTTGDIALMSSNALTFNGSSSITIPAGAEVISDPVALNLTAESDLVISLFLPAQKITTVTEHQGALQTNFVAPGNLVRERSLTAPAAGLQPPQTVQKITSWLFLKSVDVQDPADTGAVVAFGDSITDGYASTLDTNRRWPDDLARRLQADKQTQNLAVLNEGISGNRILHEGWGPSALARFDREVLALPGVRYLIVLEGINDIGVGYGPTNPHDTVTTDQLIAGLSQLADRAHTHGIKVFGATLTPYLGAKYSSPAGEQVRESLNAWIRTTKVFDGVIDFDKATESSTTPGTFSPAFDCGDHLHPNDAGMKAMADVIDLQFFYK